MALRQLKFEGFEFFVFHFKLNRIFISLLRFTTVMDLLWWWLDALAHPLLYAHDELA